MSMVRFWRWSASGSGWEGRAEPVRQAPGQPSGRSIVAVGRLSNDGLTWIFVSSRRTQSDADGPLAAAASCQPVASAMSVARPSEARFRFPEFRLARNASISSMGDGRPSAWGADTPDPSGRRAPTATAEAAARLVSRRRRPAMRTHAQIPIAIAEPAARAIRTPVGGPDARGASALGAAAGSGTTEGATAGAAPDVVPPADRPDEEDPPDEIAPAPASTVAPGAGVRVGAGAWAGVGVGPDVGAGIGVGATVGSTVDAAVGIEVGRAVAAGVGVGAGVGLGFFCWPGGEAWGEPALAIEARGPRPAAAARPAARRTGSNRSARPRRPRDGRRSARSAVTERLPEAPAERPVCVRSICDVVPGLLAT